MQEVFGPHLAVLMGCSWLSIQGSLLAVFRGSCVIIRIKPESATCKASGLNPTLSVWTLFVPILYSVFPTVPLRCSQDLPHLPRFPKGLRNQQMKLCTSLGGLNI